METYARKAKRRLTAFGRCCRQNTGGDVTTLVLHAIMRRTMFEARGNASRGLERYCVQWKNRRRFVFQLAEAADDRPVLGEDERHPARVR
jgi:hypothetical protein